MGNKDFSNKLKQARLRAGLSQKEVYEKLGVVQSTFSSWEIGKSEPDADTLIKLCEIYGINSFSYFNDNKNYEKYSFKNNINKINYERISDMTTLKNKYLENGFNLDIYTNDFTENQDVRIIDIETSELYDNVEIDYFFKHYEPILDYIKRIKYYKNLTNNQTLTLSEESLIKKYLNLDEHSKNIISATIDNFEKLTIYTKSAQLNTQSLYNLGNNGLTNCIKNADLNPHQKKAKRQNNKLSNPTQNTNLNSLKENPNNNSIKHETFGNFIDHEYRDKKGSKTVDYPSLKKANNDINVAENSTDYNKNQYNQSSYTMQSNKTLDDEIQNSINLNENTDESAR